MIAVRPSTGRHGSEAAFGSRHRRVGAGQPGAGGEDCPGGGQDESSRTYCVASVRKPPGNISPGKQHDRSHMPTSTPASRPVRPAPTPGQQGQAEKRLERGGELERCGAGDRTELQRFSGMDDQLFGGEAPGMNFRAR